MHIQPGYLRLVVTILSTLLISLTGWFLIQLAPASQNIALASTGQHDLPTPTPTLTLTPLPTSTPPGGLVPTTDVDLKSVLFFSSGSASDIESCPAPFAGGPNYPKAYQLSSYIRHQATNGGGDLCVIGFPLNDGDLVTIQLLDESSNLVASQTVLAKKNFDGTGELVTNDYLEKNVGDLSRKNTDPNDPNSPVEDFMQIRVSMQPYLPVQGIWVISTDNAEVRTDLWDVATYGGAVVINPSDDLLGASPCPVENPGGVIGLRAFTLPADSNIAVGVYQYLFPNSLLDPSARLVSGQFLHSDSTGIVDGVIQLPQTMSDGTYFVDIATKSNFSCYFNVAQAPITSPTPPPPGDGTYFDEEFDGSDLNSSIWTLENTSEYAYVDNGTLQMAASGSRFPFVHSITPLFPTGDDFRATVRFDYPEANVCGVGLMMTSEIPTAGQSPYQSGVEQRAAEDRGVAIGFWQDQSGMQLWYRAGAERQDIPLGGPFLTSKDFTVEYSGGRYNLYIDNALMYVSGPTTARPEGIWMGNPQDLGYGNYCAWDSFEVDSIVIQKLP